MPEETGFLQRGMRYPPVIQSEPLAENSGAELATSRTIQDMLMQFFDQMSEEHMVQLAELLGEANGGNNNDEETESSNNRLGQYSVQYRPQIAVHIKRDTKELEDVLPPNTEGLSERVVQGSRHRIRSTGLSCDSGNRSECQYDG